MESFKNVLQVEDNERVEEEEEEDEEVVEVVEVEERGEEGEGEREGEGEEEEEEEIEMNRLEIINKLRITNELEMNEWEINGSKIDESEPYFIPADGPVTMIVNSSSASTSVSYSSFLPSSSLPPPCSSSSSSSSSVSPPSISSPDPSNLCIPLLPTPIHPITIKGMPQYEQFHISRDIENLQQEFRRTIYNHQLQSNKYQTLDTRIQYWGQLLMKNLATVHGQLADDHERLCLVHYGHWFLIGHIVYQLYALWQRHKAEIKARSLTRITIDTWLPNVLKNINSCHPRLYTYKQLYKYKKLFENRDVIIPICKLREEYIFNMDLMINQLNEFHKAVKYICEIRNYEYPSHDTDKQIELYSEYLKFHYISSQKSAEIGTEGENEENENEKEEEKKTEEEEEEEEDIDKKKKKKKDIEQLKAELRECKKKLQGAQLKLCTSERELFLTKKNLEWHHKRLDQLSLRQKQEKIKIMKEYHEMITSRKKLEEHNTLLQEQLGRATYFLSQLIPYMEDLQKRQSIISSLSSSFPSNSNLNFIQNMKNNINNNNNNNNSNNNKSSMNIIDSNTIPPSTFININKNYDEKSPPTRIIPKELITKPDRSLITPGKKKVSFSELPIQSNILQRIHIASKTKDQRIIDEETKRNE